MTEHGYAPEGRGPVRAMSSAEGKPLGSGEPCGAGRVPADAPLASPAESAAASAKAAALKDAEVLMGACCARADLRRETLRRAGVRYLNEGAAAGVEIPTGVLTGERKGLLAPRSTGPSMGEAGAGAVEVTAALIALARTAAGRRMAAARMGEADASAAAGGAGEAPARAPALVRRAVMVPKTGEAEPLPIWPVLSR